MKRIGFPRQTVRLVAAGVIATTMATGVATLAFADMTAITIDNFSNDMVSTFTCGSGGTVSGHLNFTSPYTGSVTITLAGKVMGPGKFTSTGQDLTVPVNITAAGGGSVAFSFTNASTFNSNTMVQDTIFRVDVVGSNPSVAGGAAGESSGPSFQCTAGGTTTTTTSTTTTGTTTTGTTTTSTTTTGTTTTGTTTTGTTTGTTTTGPGGGGPPPPATPELGSGELVATGLLPLVGILVYRRTRRRR